MTADPGVVAPKRSRRLFVAWQDPETRLIEPVAVLVQDVTGELMRYRFGYIRRIHDLRRFQPFTSFPDVERIYDSPTLFPFFENRVLPRRRSDYREMMDLLHLGTEAEPFEVLARSGARRATDHLEVFPEPERDPRTGEGTCLFFARGLRYVPGSEDAIDELSIGVRVAPLLDIQNEVNPKSVLLRDDHQRLLGFVPDYLVRYLHDVIELCPRNEIRISVEHVNGLTSPRHMRLLCRLTSCWPDEYRPFTDRQFEPIAEQLADPHTAPAVNVVGSPIHAPGSRLEVRSAEPEANTHALFSLAPSA